MPNRVVRESILDSDRVNQLSWASEVFYRRLMSIVDDFGRCDARSEILRSKLYPLRLGVVSSSDIVKWLDECSGAGLIRRYTISSREYLEILDFNQTVRIKKGKVPAPDSDCKQMHADATQMISTCMSETKRNESETETVNTHVNVSRGSPAQDDCYDSGTQMFEEIRDDEQFIERLLRIVQQSGYISCNGVVILKAVRFFITRESAKPEFKYRPRTEHKNYLINWITKNATTLNQYAKGT